MPSEAYRENICLKFRVLCKNIKGRQSNNILYQITTAVTNLVKKFQDCRFGVLKQLGFRPFSFYGHSSDNCEPFYSKCCPCYLIICPYRIWMSLPTEQQ
jgi:hypothetical protein